MVDLWQFGSLLTLPLQDESSKRPEMRLNVPESLKSLLVDDWEAVTKNNQVCPFRLLTLAG